MSWKDIAKKLNESGLGGGDISLLKVFEDKKRLPSYADAERAVIRGCGSMPFLVSMAQELKLFELWTKEYIDELAKYIIVRAQSLVPIKEREKKDIIVLEVGAGDGKLTHFLQKAINKRGVYSIKVIATDNGKWQVKPTFEVENLSYQESIEKYQPDIIISSWMPYREDWTPEFRSAQSVREYILIGESDGGCCGADSTWGVGERFSSVPLPDYEKDHFNRIDLDDLSMLQICRTDYADYDDGIMRHSRTVSFRRMEK